MSKLDMVARISKRAGVEQKHVQAEVQHMLDQILDVIVIDAGYNCVTSACSTSVPRRR
jgi:hypothetical protein